MSSPMPANQRFEAGQIVEDINPSVAQQWLAKRWIEVVEDEPEEASESNENAVAPKRRGRKPKAPSEDLL